MTSDTMKSGVAEADRIKSESRQPLHRRKMSKSAPILNGSDDNNAPDYQESMVLRQVNLAAAFHDHISCTKSADLCKIQESSTKESRMNLPCETDHIYANFGDKLKIHNTSISPSKEWDGEKRQLYELCLLQLELLKVVEEKNSGKDKLIQVLKQENETLKVRQERMERRMCLLKKNMRSEQESDSISDVGSAVSDSQLSPASAATPKPAVTTEAAPVTRPTVRLVTRYLGRRSKTIPLRALKRRYLGPPKSFPSKRPAIKHSPSTASMSSASESQEEEKTVINDGACTSKIASPVPVQLPETVVLTKTRKKQSKRHKVIPRLEDFLTTDKEYYLPEYYSSQDSLDSTQIIDVPSWRYKPVSSFYQMEGTENIDDRVFQRRHLKCEQDEKRRKRWDIQRLREQKATEKLKYKKGYGGSKNDRDEQKKSVSLYPNPNNLEFIEVTNRLPVLAFGVPIPLFQPSEFSLPWKMDLDSREGAIGSSSGNKVT